MTTPPPTTKPSSAIGVIIAIYMIIMALLMLCAGAGVTFLGSVGVSLGSQLGSGVSGVGGLVTLIGIAYLVLGVASLAVAIGIFMFKPWAYNGILAVNGIYIALTVLGLVLNSGLNLGGNIVVSLLFIVASGACIYFTMTDANLKSALGH